MLKTYLDIVVDSLKNKPFEAPILILTSDGIPVRLYPNQSEFQIHTPFLSTCSILGFNYQDNRGYLCHGPTKTAVRQPYLGQSVYFWSTNKYRSIPSDQSVMRIYSKSIKELIPNIAQYILRLGDQLKRKQDYPSFFDLHILQEAEVNHPYQGFLCNLLICAIFAKGNGWSLSKYASDAIRDIAPNYFNWGINALYASGLLSENEKGEIQVSEALYILFMAALHEQKPMSTAFDENGLLVVASNS